MSELFEKVSITESPTEKGSYLTDYGRATYFPETENWINNFGPCKPIYWMRPLLLSANFNELLYQVRYFQEQGIKKDSQIAELEKKLKSI